MQPATLLARASDLQTALGQLYALPTGPAQVTLAHPTQLYQALLQVGPLVADRTLLEYTPLSELAAAPGLSTVNTADLGATETALQGGARWLLTTPLQHPYLTLPDLDALATLGQRYGCTLLVDQTLTPLLEPLLEPVGGALYRNLNLLTGQVQPTQNQPTQHQPPGELAALCLLPGCLPTGCLPPGLSLSSLTTPPPASGLQTLTLRLRAHSGHAQAIADVLAGHPGVRAVYHPGLSTHPQFEYAQGYFTQGYGGVVYADSIVPDFAARLTAPHGRWLFGAQAMGGAHSALWTVPSRPTLHGLWAGLEDIDDLLTELEGALA